MCNTGEQKSLSVEKLRFVWVCEHVIVGCKFHTFNFCPLVCFRLWIQRDLTQSFDQRSFSQPLYYLLQVISLKPSTHLHLVPLAKRFKASKISLCTRGMQGGWDKIIGSNISPLVSKGQHSSLNPRALGQNPRKCSVISNAFW